MRILVLSNYGFWGDFDPRTAYREMSGEHRQIGGGETAMVNISYELAQRGHEVMVFYGNVSGKFDGVDYLQQAYATAMINELHHDALIVWDAMDALKLYSRSKVRVGAFQLNDARIGVLDHMADLYMCPSEWHAERFQSLYPEMTKSKFRPTTTNGINPRLYDMDYVERQQYKVIYSSSPDRGLHHLLAVWPEVKEEIPGAELHVYYDIEKWFKMIEHCMAHRLFANTEPRYHEIRGQLAELNRQGIGPTLHGGVSKAELARAHLSAHVLCYPCDPVQPTEGFSMTCLEALQAGCYLLTTEADALPELWSEFQVEPSGLLPTQGGVVGPSVLIPWPPNREHLTVQLVDLLRWPLLPNGPSQDPRLHKYHWSALAETWEKEIEACLQNR